MLKSTRFVRFAFAAVLTGTLLAGCSDQPGSEGWCQSMKDKPKGEWTGDDTKTYAAHCLLDSTTVGMMRCEIKKKVMSLFLMKPALKVKRDSA